MTKMKKKVEVAVIGAGTAGLSASREIKKVTDDFVLINHNLYGTTCVLSGCMPAKVLNITANLYHERLLMERFGIYGSEQLHINIPDVLRHVRAMREHFLASVLHTIDELGEHNIQGFATFISPQELHVGNLHIEANKIIIATGSSPNIPDEWADFSDLILTSDNIFEQEDLPCTIAVIGLSMLGVEMAQTLSRLGIHVIAIGADEMIGSLTDPEVNAYTFAALQEEMPVWTGNPARVVREDHRLRVSTGDKSIIVDKVFVALGRRPNISHMGLEELGIISSDPASLDFNPHTMRLGHYPIYIAGAAIPTRSILYEADDEGRIAGFNTVHEPEVSFSRKIPLKIIYTDPEIAIIGKSWSELIPSFIAIGEASFVDQGRAKIIAHNKGVIRIYGDKQTGRLMGAELFAPYGEHLAHLLAWVIQMKLTAYDVLKMPFYHPTAEEAIRTALHDMITKIIGHKQPARERETV